MATEATTTTTATASAAGSAARGPADGPVCVTGASGFIAAHLVAQLLERGYTVHGTVRDTSKTEKTAHLTSLPGAKERLKLFNADLLTKGSFKEAIAGCTGVFHTACPVIFTNITDADKQLMQPAINGSINVLSTVEENAATVQRVVQTSSLACVMFDGGAKGDDHTYTPEDWSDEDYMRSKNFHYPLSKTLGEKAAWKFAEGKKWSFVTVCPTLVVGPLLTPKLNVSTSWLLEYFSPSKTKISKSGNLGYVDVRDVALTHILAYEKPEASGRYLCYAASKYQTEVVAALRAAVPDATLPTEVEEGEQAPRSKVDTSAVKALGVEWQPFEKTMKDTMVSLQKKGLFPVKSE